jgi:polyhydroxybutyrate depolymerase
MKYLFLMTILAAGLHTGCSSDADSSDDATAGADAEQLEDASSIDAGDSALAGDAELAPPWDPSEPFGGDRPAEILLPDDYSTSRSWPVVFLLHGYTASATVQDAYFDLSRRRHQRGFIVVLPDGTRDGGGNRFWNATDACCNFTGSNVDDVAYLSGLLAEAKERLAVDPKRVYFMGHSNGGFMSYRMACELGSEISAIASLAGSSFGDPDDCVQDGQVGVLQIHGDADNTVSYTGGTFGSRSYPGAREVAQRWAERNGCDDQPESADPIDATSDIAGDETEVDRWSNCDPATSVELWTIAGGSHIPTPSRTFTNSILDFLWAHH